MTKLHVDSVIKSYGSKQILTDVYLSCSQGEIIGLLGRNGSGKSTLLEVIFSAIKADNKFVKVGSKLIRGIEDSRNLIKYLPQDGFLPGHLKIKDVIQLFCDQKNAEKLCAKKVIQPWLNKKPAHLSSGEERLFEVLLILHSDAKYILIDEPFNGVAPLYRDEIKRLIKANTSTKGFIITDHDYRNILDLATKTIIMFDGGTKPITDDDDLRLWGYLSEPR